MELAPLTTNSNSFSHRTFRWSNEATGKAAVHCVIIGFGRSAIDRYRLFDYEKVNSEPHEIFASRINAYLVDAPDAFLHKRSNSICPCKPLNYGSMANDDGHLILDRKERDELLAQEPTSTQFIRRYVGAQEFLNSTERWCLWLKDVSPRELNIMLGVRTRVEAVRKFRLKSDRAESVKLAAFRALFGEIRQPEIPYIILPRVSSENRPVMPIGVLSQEIIANGSALIIPGGESFDLGVLTSNMHMAWMRAVAGLMKSDYQYSAQIVYNNYPWPDLSDANANSCGAKSGFTKQKEAIELAAQAVLDARAAHPTSSLADLYDPLSMPANLVKAHQKLDAAVDAVYFAAYAADGAKKSWKSDAERVAFLFTLYQKFTSLLPVDATKPTRARTKKPETSKPAA